MEIPKTDFNCLVTATYEACMRFKEGKDKVIKPQKQAKEA